MELAKKHVLGCYYSGYPTWKLPYSGTVPVCAHSLRTNIVYGMLKFLPDRLRPSSRSLFLWQDHAFDRWVARRLERCDYVHALPGQCLATFQSARKQGIRTVLNHATGPVVHWVKIMRPEYARVGLDMETVSPFDAAYFLREAEEYALADFHCAASTVVRDQLVERGIPAHRIWVVGYGADTNIFHPGNTPASVSFRIIFCGAVGLRKGIRTLLTALEEAGRQDWEMHFYGPKLPESKMDIAAYNGSTKLEFHGAVRQQKLAEAFRQGSVLVLPSLEEGFGLVIPQALNCGLPCIVSDRVGGKDLIKHHENGSIFPSGDSATLLAELRHWERETRRPSGLHEWKRPACDMLTMSEKHLS